MGNTPSCKEIPTCEGGQNGQHGSLHAFGIVRDPEKDETTLLAK